jgi:hypothetical protein
MFTAVLLAASFATLAAEPERPHRGSCSTVVTPGDSSQELKIDSDCRLTHLGRASGQTLQTVVPVPGEPGEPDAPIPLLIRNTTVYWAANGDQLNMSFLGTGQLDPVSGEVTFVGTETYQGGTGRFANATGSATAQGSASVFTNLGSFTIQGRIAY